MKSLYKNAQIKSLLLSFIFLLQSCHVYLQKPVNLEEAVQADKRMKVVTTNNKKYKFRKIKKTDSLYYGIAQKNGKQVKTPLEKDKIQSIHPVDKTTSTILTTGTVLISAGVILFVIAWISFNNDPYYYDFETSKNSQFSSKKP